MKFKYNDVLYRWQSMCEESDIKEMGIPLGPRKKIQGYLKKIQRRKVVYKTGVNVLLSYNNPNDIIMAM